MERRKDMKHYRKNRALVWAALLAIGLTALVGCSKSYPGVHYDEMDGSMIGSQETFDSVPILLTFNAPELNFATRGLGPIDQSYPRWAKEQVRFYVFAFQAPNFAAPNASRIDYRVTHAQDANMCLVDGTAENAIGHGKAVRLSNTGDNDLLDGSLTWAGDVCYYNNEHQDYKYHFFAYNIDDARLLTNTVQRTKDSITLELEVDGTQDLIYSVARPAYTEDELEHMSGEDFKSIFEKGIDNYVYSTMLGHRNIHPNFRMKHSMVRFNFNMKQGDNAAENIYIEDIILYATHRGRFTVAHQDTTRLGFIAMGDTVAYHLPERIETGDEDRSYSFTPVIGPEAEGFVNQYSFALTDEDRIPVGTDILLPPQLDYKLQLKCKQVERLEDGSEGREFLFSPIYTLSSPTKAQGETFKPGCLYTVNITVYGLQPITLQASNLHWEAYKDTIIVDDEMPELAPLTD